MPVLALAFIALWPDSEPAPPQELNDRTFAAVRAYAAPRPSDLQFIRLPWHSNLVSAVNQARKEDKPILLWMYFGDPRSQC
jgi:hypothetical protein